MCNSGIILKQVHPLKSGGTLIWWLREQTENVQSLNFYDV